MKNILSADNEVLLGLKQAHSDDLSVPTSFPFYTVILIMEGSGIYHADFGNFPFAGQMLLFSTPLQQIHISADSAFTYQMLQFHGDFYCIEYHKAQVSCNGLLFNNIYIEPSVKLTNHEALAFERLLADMEQEFTANPADDIVLRSFLQLFLAKSSSIKMRSMDAANQQNERDEQMEQFSKLLNTHFLQLHKPTDYANLLSMTPNNFSKRCTRYFKKSPSVLIQERIILEAKKKLHLTRLSIKEIAYSLNFSDEFYFSRFFKKFTQVSPQSFREKAGISIVADMPE
ncbi:helix-turn-helix domain-containing protein [Mucilaginibacter agri]|uniref:Helix-turn-helix domain-containing protein n=1 Tax=Mucilaginibacter agri TaxID=2695265 RepID=A0A965ZHC8_9SPHI|nr:helix-turn-helix domain-containing protein [Mucilaginibacter agri]NCD69767.1 helix-turn-helix domain-containing protein [Mucilaginibacter agri]